MKDSSVELFSLIHLIELEAQWDTGIIDNLVSDPIRTRIFESLENEETSSFADPF